MLTCPVHHKWLHSAQQSRFIAQNQNGTPATPHIPQPTMQIASTNQIAQAAQHKATAVMQSLLPSTTQSSQFNQALSNSQFIIAAGMTLLQSFLQSLVANSSLMSNRSHVAAIGNEPANSPNVSNIKEFLGLANSPDVNHSIKI